MTEFKIDRKSDKALYVQIKDCLYNAIKSGELKEGERLPTVIGFAKKFGVTQATINKALEELSKQGWIESHVGRGTFVSHPKKAENSVLSEKIAATGFFNESVTPEFISAAKRLRMGVAQSLEMFEAFANRPGLVNMVSPFPDPSIAKKNILLKMTEKAFKQFEQKSFQNYASAQGLNELRECIARRYKKSGINISPEQILITNGSQQGISIAAMEALENKRRVICETPSYRGAFNAFTSVGHWVETLLRDTNGPVLSYLDKFKDNRSSVIYLGTEFHNPMGTDISEERAEGLVNWVNNNNSYLLADEIFKDLRFEGQPKESFLVSAGTEYAAIITSLSKSFMSGLRIGWMISSKERIKSMLLLKRSADLSTTPLMQGIALLLLESGEYDSHLESAKKHYKLRRDAMIEALSKCMPDGINWTLPSGGFHMWCELPEGYSSIALFLLAINKGVIIRPGPQFDLDHRFINAFNIGYGSLEIDKIREGVKLLANAIKELLKSPPGNAGLSGLGGFL